MKQPPGYVVEGENMVCKLKKAIYGLKQSPLVWFEKFSRVASEGGFQKCHSNHSVFIYHSSPGSVILTIYIDNILLTGSDYCFKYRPIYRYIGRYTGILSKTIR